MAVEIAVPSFIALVLCFTKVEAWRLVPLWMVTWLATVVTVATAW